MDVAYILHVIHSFSQPHKYVYGDFKPENFLMDGDRVIICDLDSLNEEGSYNVRDSEPYTEDVYDNGRWVRMIDHQKGDIFKYGKLIIALMTAVPILEPIGAVGEMIVVRYVRERMLDRWRTEPWQSIMRPNMVVSGCQETTARRIIELAAQCMDPIITSRPTAIKIVDELIAIEEHV